MTRWIAAVLTLSAFGCIKSPRDQTADLVFTKGLEVSRRSRDIAGDDAGYFRIFVTERPVADVLKDAEKELTSDKGWTRVMNPKDFAEFQRSEGAMKFTVKLRDTVRGAAIVHSQRVPEDQMF